LSNLVLCGNNYIKYNSHFPPKLINFFHRKKQHKKTTHFLFFFSSSSPKLTTIPFIRVQLPQWFGQYHILLYNLNYSLLLSQINPT
jgi:hypothetical protein